jgi:tetratricopeptide (TPR) repeat protein
MWLVRLFFGPLRIAAMFLGRALLWCSRVECGGLWVVDLSCWDDDLPAEFGDQIERAMRLIHERDARRAKWITARLDYIVNTRLAAEGGAYDRMQRACYINYPAYRNAVVGDGEFTFRSQQVLTIELARVIVHEATHARIDQKGIEYNERYRERIELFCRRQEVHFLKRAAVGFTDVLGNLIDWEQAGDFSSIKDWYYRQWQRSRLDRIRQHLKNAADEIRGTSRHDDPAATWKEEHHRSWHAADAFQPWTEAMLRSRAMYLYYAKNFAAAATDFRRLVAVDPDWEDEEGWLAASLYYNREYQEALDLWLAMYEAGNRAVAGWISHCQYLLDRHEEALRWHERTADSHPDAADFRIGRVWPLIGTGRHEEALGELDQVAEEQHAEFGTFDFTYRALHAWLAHELGDRERFRELRDDIYAARDWWCQCCEAEPARTRAWVLRVRDGIHRPGIESYRAQLLICTDDLPPFDWHAYMERLAEAILGSKDSDDRGYDAAYLRSLLPWNDDYPWREVPDDLTGGKRVYVVDMMLDRLFLPGGYLQGPSVTCWVEKTPDGYKAALAETYDSPPHEDCDLACEALRNRRTPESLAVQRT